MLFLKQEMRDFEKELNKLVLKVDGGKNEWTFKGEVWQTIRDWARQRDLEWQKKITEIVNNMPDCFPERESDEYERAYRDAKSYIINKLKQ